MYRPRRLRAWRLLILSLGLAGACGTAAQAHGVFSTPAQTTTQTLRDLARAAHMQVLFPGEALAGLKSPAILNAPDIMAAFAQALKGTGFEARQIDAHTFIVARRAQAASPDTHRNQPVEEPRPAFVPSPQITEVVVTGRRQRLSAIASAEASSDAAVQRLSRTEMSERVSQNVTEALGALSGMTVLPTGRSFIGGIDSASRGEGLFSAFRGLDTGFNLNMINGVTVAQGLPYSRGVQLNLLPSDGFSHIDIASGGRSDQDGDVLGAMINFITPEADDFADGKYGALTVSAHLNARALSYGGPAFGAGAGFEVAHRFGARGELGVYVGGQIEQRPFMSSELAGIMAASSANGWGYTLAGSVKGAPVDPSRPEDNLTLSAFNAGASRGENRTHFLSVAIDRQMEDGSRLFLRATDARSDTQQESTFSQLVGTGNRYVLGTDGLYHLSIAGVSTRIWYETNPDQVTLSTLKIGHERTIGAWRLTPSVLLSRGSSARPNHIEASARIDQTDAYNTQQSTRAVDGTFLSYADNLPVLNLSPAIYDDLNDAGSRLLARRAGQLTAQFSEQTRFGLAYDASYVPGGALAIDLGAKLTDSRRRVTNRDWTNDFYANLLHAPGLTWSQLGLIDGYYPAVFPGLYSWALPRVDQGQLLSDFYHYQTPGSFDTCGSLIVNNLNCNTQVGSERVAAAYAIVHLEHAHWGLHAGLRFERTDIANTYWVLPVSAGSDTPGNWARSSTHYNQLLPSLRLRLGADPGNLWQVSLWRGYSRPAFLQLGGGTRIETDASGLTTITRGNPNLKSVSANNLDLDWRHEMGANADLHVTAYAKWLEHYLYEAGNTITGALQADGSTTRVVTPQNGGRGRVLGLDAHYDTSWPLPGRLGGRVSFDGHAGWQATRVDLGSDALGHNMPMQSAPTWLSGATLGYSRGRTAIFLSCRHTGAYLSNYNTLDADGTWDNTWVRPNTRCDARARQNLTGHMRAEIELGNLTHADSYWAHIGRHSLAISDVIRDGQRLSVRLNYTY